MSEVDKKWADRIRAGDRRVLMRQFSHEADELRRIAAEKPGSFHAPWRDFRNFLADVGPSPGPAYQLQMKTRGPGGYRPGAVVWRLRGESPDDPDDRPLGSQWTMISGMQPGVDLPSGESNAFSFALARTGEGGAGGDGGDQSGATIDIGELGWFSPNRAHQEAFRLAYAAWRAQVQPKYRSAATPQFLYLFTLIPAMARCKATLEEAGLWKPLTKSLQEQRDDHSAWKRFNELLPKATMTIAGFEIYRQYSLTEDIDELNTRIQAAELRFRAAGRDVQRGAAA